MITGWSDGVATMKTGERATFVIQSGKAYGPPGSPPKIPPNATLQFDIGAPTPTHASTLHSWHDRDPPPQKKILTDRVRVGGWAQSCSAGRTMSRCNRPVVRCS